MCITVLRNLKLHSKMFEVEGESKEAVENLGYKVIKDIWDDAMLCVVAVTPVKLGALDYNIGSN